MAAIVFQTVRAVDQRNILKLEFVDDQYALKFADKLLATRVIGAFGLLAFVIAAAGIYGVMAFLVAHRAHEIGIRIALGADASRINRLVMGSSLRLVLLGAALGIGGAIAASRWAESQLFGVRAADPATLAVVTLGVVATALLATWHPGAAGDPDRSESAVEGLAPAEAGRHRNPRTESRVQRIDLLADGFVITSWVKAQRSRRASGRSQLVWTH